MIAEIDSIAVELTGVIIWPSEIEIRLTCPGTERPAQIDSDYARLVSDWRVRREQGEKDVFPESPAHAILGRL